MSCDNCQHLVSDHNEYGCTWYPATCHCRTQNFGTPTDTSPLANLVAKWRTGEYRAHGTLLSRQALDCADELEALVARMCKLALELCDNREDKCYTHIHPKLGEWGKFTSEDASSEGSGE